MVEEKREYKKYQLSLVKKYGARSVVLLQVGSFYEIYADENDFGKTEQVSKVLNIQQIEKIGMNSLLGVSQGSFNEPREDLTDLGIF